MRSRLDFRCQTRARLPQHQVTPHFRRHGEEQDFAGKVGQTIRYDGNGHGAMNAMYWHDKATAQAPRRHHPRCFAPVLPLPELCT